MGWGVGLTRFVRDLLDPYGIKTFGQLKQDDPGSAFAPEFRHRLVVHTADISKGRLVRLPWDFEELYQVKPDLQSVAYAVRASASITYFFRPVTAPRGETWVDGGLLSNFPIDVFDRTPAPGDGDVEAPLTTIGIKLSAGLPHEQRVSGVVTLSSGLLHTLGG